MGLDMDAAAPPRFRSGRYTRLCRAGICDTIMAMNAARCLAIGLWVACVVLRLSLPAWDVCWHRDGRVCDEAVPRACCGAESPESGPADEDCADCTDLHLEPGSSPQRPPVAAGHPHADVELVGAVSAPATPFAVLASSVLFPGVAPPQGPALHDVLPLRC